MKQRLIDIKLISIILLMIAFATGCKEKTESYYICDNCPHIGWFGEPNSCEKFRAAQAAFDDEPEPNEPEEPRYYHPLDPRAYTCPKCYDGAKGTLCPGHYEPNETNKPLDFIPTWPEYIELEKDVIASHLNEQGWTVINLLPKGTKIYFKEDE